MHLIIRSVQSVRPEVMHPVGTACTPQGEFVYACMHVRTCVRTCVCMYACVYVLYIVCVCVNLCLYACVPACKEGWIDVWRDGCIRWLGTYGSPTPSFQKGVACGGGCKCD